MDVWHKYKDSPGKMRRMNVCMKMSQFFQLSASDFWVMIKEIEESDLFRKLHGIDSGISVLKIRPAQTCVEFSDGKSPGFDDFTGRLSIFKNLKIFDKIKDLGGYWFTCNFLRGDVTNSELAQVLGVSYETVENLRSNLPVYGGGLPSLSGGEVVARLRFTSDEIKIDLSHPSLRYEIDEEKVDSMVKSGFFLRKEAVALKSLSRSLSIINLRFSLLNKIVNAVVKFQNQYLLQSDPLKIRSLEGKVLARYLQIDPSWVSRLVKEKYLLAGGRYFPLRDLLVSRREMSKKIGKELLVKLISRQNLRLRDGIIARPYSDEEVRLQLNNEFKVKISRRSVNNWRREIEGEAFVSG